MDFNQNSENSNYVPNQPSQRPSGFATASLVCGILSLVLCCTGILGIPAGALSILFAVLSKRKGESLSGMSIAGIVSAPSGRLRAKTAQKIMMAISQKPGIQAIHASAGTLV